MMVKRCSGESGRKRNAGRAGLATDKRLNFVGSEESAPEPEVRSEDAGQRPSPGRLVVVCGGLRVASRICHGEVCSAGGSPWAWRSRLTARVLVQVTSLYPSPLLLSLPPSPSSCRRFCPCLSPSPCLPSRVSSVAVARIPP